MKPIYRRPAAIDDMIRHVAYRRGTAGEASASTLVDDMQACLRSIAEAPATGSRRIGQLLGVPELQWKRVGKTRLWFWYVERAAHVDVIRLVSTDQLPRQAMLPDDLH
jgi:plasmid stabilization system protein ParE